MTLPKAFTTSTSQDWQTPPHIYIKLGWDYGITFVRDLCASKENRICNKYYSKEQDCRYRDWTVGGFGEANWCNPPYGDGIIPDIARLACRSKSRTNVVMLVPCNKTDQKWFHEFAVDKALILFVEGRIGFLKDGKAIQSNSQGSMLICWGPAFDTDIGSFKQDKGIV